MGYRKGDLPKTAGQLPAGQPKRRHAGARAIGRIARFIDEPERLTKFLQYIELGSSQGTAAECVGWDPGTVAGWSAKAECDDEDGPYSRYAEQVRSARAKAVMTHLACVSLAAKGGPVYDADGRVVGLRDSDWKASRFMLSVLEPARYSNRSMIELTGPGGGAVEISTTDSRAVMASLFGSVGPGAKPPNGASNGANGSNEHEHD